MRSLLFTDLYQLTMAAAYFRSGKAQAQATFEVFFRKCPFQGEYVVVGGHDRLQSLLTEFRFSSEDIQYLRRLDSLAQAPDSFFEALKNLDFMDVEVWGLEEGELAFPRIPLLQLHGPLWKLQILESAILNAINFASLVATYARRMRQAAGDWRLLEFGLRRAQGPDGALTASRASFLGGFDGTSCVEAARRFDIPASGTMAHSFVQSFSEKEARKILPQSLHERIAAGAHWGELAAFWTYAQAFPDKCVLLVDTYHTLKSGLPNALLIFDWLKENSHSPKGIRLDSGDLNYLSRESRRLLNEAGFHDVQIWASNDLSESIIASLKQQGAELDGLGVGTHLVTCREEPALGGVFKLVELEGEGRMKISEQTEKTSLPWAKQAYRLYGQDGHAILDWLSLKTENPPQSHEEIEALHPFDPFKKARVRPAHVRALLKPLFAGHQWHESLNLREKRERSLQRMNEMRPDILRRENPTPYKVSLSALLKQSFDRLYDSSVVPPELQ